MGCRKGCGAISTAFLSLIYHILICRFHDLHPFSASTSLGTPSQPWLCKTAWTSRRYPACWATTTPDSRSAPTPTPPDKNRTKQRPRWVPSWSRCCEDQDQKKSARRHNPPARYSCLHCFLSASGSRCGSSLKPAFFCNSNSQNLQQKTPEI